jgi:predicted heme/steroid binding protein
MKKVLSMFAVVTVIALSACAAEDPVVETSTPDVEERVFTLEELATYNGQDGQPAYVAVNGVVYDLTSSTMWRNGSHNGVQAGQDLTSIFQSQHGDDRLGEFPVVGRLE